MCSEIIAGEIVDSSGDLWPATRTSSDAAASAAHFRCHRETAVGRLPGRLAASKASRKWVWRGSDDGSWGASNGLKNWRTHAARAVQEETRGSALAVSPLAAVDAVSPDSTHKPTGVGGMGMTPEERMARQRGEAAVRRPGKRRSSGSSAPSPTRVLVLVAEGREITRGDAEKPLAGDAGGEGQRRSPEPRSRSKRRGSHQRRAIAHLEKAISRAGEKKDEE